MTRSKFNPYIVSVAIVILVTFFGELIKRYIEPANLVMIYLLAVVVVSVKWGKGPAIAASVLSVFIFDFFLVPPYLTLAVDDWQYLFTFIGLLIVALVISELTTKARKETEKARQLELLRETEKLQTVLLNSMSHDLKTPLSSIVGSISMLLQDVPSLSEETIKGLLQDALSESRRLNHLIGNLLDMARMESGALRLSPKPCELRDVIGVSLKELSCKLDNRRVEVRISKDLPEILVDFTWIGKVFVNVIDNAIKYSSENSPIVICANAYGQEVRIEIEDEGLGINPGDHDKIFTKFYRAQKNEKVGGLGLGLSICKGIVEAHHGKIWAQNNEKKGARFILTLPAAANFV